MKKALAIGLAAVMAVSMSAPVFAEDEGKGIAKEDLKVGVIYIGIRCYVKDWREERDIFKI